jgi:ferredoxin
MRTKMHARSLRQKQIPRTCGQAAEKLHSDHCHGCGDLCPLGAITYVGDDTGWVPPNGIPSAEAQESCACECSATEELSVEYLYLDLNSCERCIGTDAVLEEVLRDLSPALALAGCRVRYSKTEIATAQLAERHAFLSSPTIRVNGQDICGSIKETACGCCSDISGTDVDCRAFEYKGHTYEIPPKEMLAREILRTAFASHKSETKSTYILPGNLRTFLKGKPQNPSVPAKTGAAERFLRQKDTKERHKWRKSIWTIKTKAK